MSSFTDSLLRDFALKHGLTAEVVAAIGPAYFKSLTQDERRGLIMLEIQSDITVSDNRIARDFGVNNETVAAVRRAMGAESPIRIDTLGRRQRTHNGFRKKR